MRPLDVFIIVIVFAFVFLLAMSCFLMPLIKCLKGQKSPRSLFEGVPKMYLPLSLSLSLSFLLSFVGQVMFSHHSDQTSQRSQVRNISLFVLESHGFQKYSTCRVLSLSV